MKKFTFHKAGELISIYAIALSEAYRLLSKEVDIKGWKCVDIDDFKPSVELSDKKTRYYKSMLPF